MRKRCLYHYTSLDALRNILGENLCLWATRYDSLNDPSEQIWAEKYVLEHIKTIKEFQDYSSKDLINWFGKDSYILSLCKKRDDRNMWRLYCNDGRGVCLVLDEDIMNTYCNQRMDNDYKNFFCLIEDVQYSLEKSIEKNFHKIKKKENFNFTNEESASKIMRVVPFIKNADFKIEAEVRCVVLREIDFVEFNYDESIKGPSEPIFYKNNNDVKYRMRSNKIVPYMDILFPPEALKKIILGYEVKEKDAILYIENILKTNRSKYRKLKIEKSKLVSSIDQNNYMKTLV